MSLLGDCCIALSLQEQFLDLEPVPDLEAIQPASIDVRLGPEVRRQLKTGYPISRHNPAKFYALPIGPDPSGEETDPRYEGFVLRPGEFYLGHTLENFTLGPRAALKLEGKSSWGRVGLEVHSTAGWIDPGFAGQITFEMKVVGVDPVLVKPGDYIAQVCVFILGHDCQRPYGSWEHNSKYQGQQGPTEAVVW